MFWRAGSILQEVLAVRAHAEYRSPAIVGAAVLLVAIVVGGATGLAMWRGERKSIETFYRWFPLYALVELPGTIVIFSAAIGFVNLAAGLLLLPILVYLPFYERGLARKLLRR